VHHEGAKKDPVRYVVGLRFSEDRSRVVLIRKNRPDWQRGMLNGPGGRVEPGETILAGMAREFLEEAGVPTDAHEWTPTAMLSVEGDPRREIVFLCSAGDISRARTTTDEEIVVAAVAEIALLPLVAVIPWVVPLSLYRMSGRMDGEQITVFSRQGAG